jgi:hypothetical protein
MATVTRYVCTYVNQDGMRALMTAALGRYTYETAADAQQHLDAILCDNSASTLAYLYGHNFKPEVRPCQCLADHFDPVGIYFD